MWPAVDATTCTFPGLVDPLPHDLHQLLRRAVLDHITSERRRVHSAVVHAGLPGRAVATLSLDDERLDPALGADVLEAMLRRLGPGSPATPGADGCSALVWLTRPGTLEVQDVDLLWACAAGTAGVELGRRVPMVVVTRQGWRDPRTGTTRTWRRLRAPRC